MRFDRIVKDCRSIMPIEQKGGVIINRSGGEEGHRHLGNHELGEIDLRRAPAEPQDQGRERQRGRPVRLIAQRPARQKDEKLRRIGQ